MTMDTPTPTGLRLALAALLVLLQASCSTLTTQPSSSSSLFQPNETLRTWQISGKIGIKTAQGADSAYLNWLQCDAYFDVRLNGPLGSGSARLTGNSEQVGLYVSGKQPIYAADAEQLLWEQFGWSLPVYQLRYWITGLPSPEHTYQPGATGFTQRDWALDFPRHTFLSPYYLPAKATAHHRDIAVTLILRDWQLNPDCEPAL